MGKRVKRGNVEFELNLAGLNELMKSDEMKEILQEAADSVAGSASSMAEGEPFGVDVHDADFVSIASIYPASKEAAQANYEENVLLKALDGSGLPKSKKG